MSCFYIKSCLNDYVLDIPGGNRDNGVAVITYPRKEDSLHSDNQLWQLDYQPDGTFLIISKMHGKALDCGGQTQGTKLILWDRHGGNNQRFRKEGNCIVSLSGLTLDIAGGNTAPGAHVILWSRNQPPSKNQMFELEPLVNQKPTPPQPGNSQPVPHQPVPNMAAKLRMDDPCIDHSVVAKIAGHLPDWQDVLKGLGVGTEEIKSIETTHQADDERRKAALRKWIEKEGSDATYKKLCKTLLSLGKKGAIQEIEAIAGSRFQEK